ncbi:ABC transporter substrate-binding protein [Kineococcus sp. NPDC059986]|jgi:NitT/TauT family transport system substrate-binding protein|uniref:ABC transporter substrate-binding protein n=1 Tax=Kineococcus sp. NPDC059986 TaxID=3155538 RepID=UPI00344F2C71
MTTRRQLLTGALLGASATALAACSGGTSRAGSAAASGRTPLSVVLGWYPTPESGGWFAAQEEGRFTDAGLDVTLQPGGPQVSGVQLVAAGRADVGIASAEDVVRSRSQGIPVVAVAALYQRNPVGVMVHADQGATSIDDLLDRTWVVQTGALGHAWVERVKGVTLKTRVYSGSIAEFLHDPALVQQGWPTNEAFTAQQAGVPVTFFSYADTGYDPYNDVVFVREDTLQDRREDVRAFLQAGLTGWSGYLSDTAVAERANAAIRRENTELDEDALWFAWDRQREFLVAGDGATTGLGAMTSQRWSDLVQAMDDLGGLQGDVDAAQVFTTDLLPTVPAPASLPPAP